MRLMDFSVAAECHYTHIDEGIFPSSSALATYSCIRNKMKKYIVFWATILCSTSYSCPKRWRNVCATGS